MSGHSHWATIKHQKEKQDNVKGKIFGKVSREILLAVQKGGGVTDPQNNVYLRTALEKAKECNVPKENVQRLLDRTTERASRLQEVLYEAFGPGNCALLIVCVTDNTNRTLAEVRFTCGKYEGKMGTPNSALFQFNKVGQFILKNATSEEDALACIEEMNALDFDFKDNMYTITVQYEALSQAISIMKQRGYDVAPAIIYVPKAPITLNDEDNAKLNTLITNLFELEDVQDVFVNVSL